MKQNIDTAKKARSEIENPSSRVDLQMKIRLHFFDSLISPILLYGCELWGYENMKQNEVFYRNFVRRMLKIGKSAQGNCVRRTGLS